MAELRHVAIIDIGKTNAKVSLVDATEASEHALRTIANPALAGGPYPHLDVALIWDFVSDSLAGLNREAAIDAIAITAHGSAGAFIDGRPKGDGLTLPILDYEYSGPDELAAEYDRARPDFCETLSPRLPGGLNLGAQIFWQERRFSKEFEAATAYVNYPQFWAWRLSGVAATEMCSMGAHSDMWNPRALTWSRLVTRRGWEKKLAPLRPAFERLGPIRPALAKRLGLDPATPIHCGIHEFERLAAAASESPYAALRRRLDRHVGHHLRSGRRHRPPRSEARHAGECQRLRRSRRLRALHGRARIRAADRRRPDGAESGRSRSRAHRAHHGAPDLLARHRAIRTR